MSGEDPHRSVDMGRADTIADADGTGTAAAPKKTSFKESIKCPWTLGAYLRLLFVLAVIGGLIAAVIFKKEVGDFLGEDGPLAKFVQRTGVWGPITFGAVYAVCTVIMIPGLVLTIAAGVIFPLWVALVTISAGSTLGACLAFLLGRTILREQVKSKIEQYPTFEAIDTAVGGGKWRGMGMVFLLRLSPVIPFNLLNYMLGLTKVAFWKYALASWVGMMPGTFMYVYISWAAKNAGATAASGKSQDSANLLKDILTYGVGGVVTILVVVLVTVIARREMQKAMARAQLETARKEAQRTGSIASADGSLNTDERNIDPSSPLLSSL